MTASCSVSTMRSTPATGTRSCFSARTSSSTKAVRRRTSTMMSPAAIGPALAIRGFRGPPILSPIRRAIRRARRGLRRSPARAARPAASTAPARRSRAVRPAATARPARLAAAPRLMVDRLRRRAPRRRRAGPGEHRVHRLQHGRVERNETVSRSAASSAPPGATWRRSTSRIGGEQRRDRRAGSCRSTAWRRRPRTPCASASRAARAGEELLGQRADDFPLVRVGVLGLVDQHVVDAAVELEQHPRRRPGRASRSRDVRIRSS